MEAPTAPALALHAAFGATRCLVAAGDIEDLETWVKVLPRPVVVATPHPAAPDHFADREDVTVMHLGFRVGGGLNALKTLRDILLSAYVEGQVAPDDRLLVVQTDASGDALLTFDMAEDESIGRLRKDLEYRVDVNVMEAVMQVAADLAREGREKNPVGALFVVGDTDRVLKHSRQVVLNPFQGHPPQDRNVLDNRTWETVKEFAQIDGAIVVRDDGVVDAAGRYIEVRDPTDLPSGLGGRHLAAAAVTTETKAIAVTVSETGVVRIFSDGRILLRIGVT